MSKYFRILQRILLNNLLQMYKICYFYWFLRSRGNLDFFLCIIKMVNKLLTSSYDEEILNFWQLQQSERSFVQIISTLCIQLFFFFTQCLLLRATYCTFINWKVVLNPSFDHLYVQINLLSSHSKWFSPIILSKISRGLSHLDLY